MMIVTTVDSEASRSFGPPARLAGESWLPGTPGSLGRQQPFHN